VTHPPELTISLHAADPRAIRLTVSGELDYTSAPRLRAALDEVPLAPGSGLIIDLSGLTFCDSSGISVLVAAHHLANAAGSTLALAAVPPAVLKVFEITGLHHIFSIYPDPEDAHHTLTR
jgi:anti-sigma B factor antagonist